MQEIKRKYKPKNGNTLNKENSAVESKTKSQHFIESDIIRQRTPLNFDGFFPWICSQWGVSVRVSVIRFQENFQKKGLSKLLNEVILVKDNEEKTDFNKELIAFKDVDKNTIKIQAYYDSKCNLVKLSIIRSPVKIPQKVIRAVSVCIPFHSTLNQLTICKGGVSYHTIYEISKLLPHSNLTDICLDDSYVPEGNYYLLLQEVTQLSYLSLNRCTISDEVCDKIAHRLMFGQPAANSLQILELASNILTDKGAGFLGGMLRTNRRLLHLNIAGNNIGDIGLAALLSSLTQFSLRNDEITRSRDVRFSYLRNKQAVYNKCLAELLEKQSSEITTYKASRSCISFKTNTRKMPSSRNHKQSGKTRELSSANEIEEYAKIFTNAIIGELIDPFCPTSVILKDKCYYGKGNFVLCSLNLAYNNLHYPSIQRLKEVVNYQQASEKISPSTGLIRLILDGNYIPENCHELDYIESYFKSKLSESRNIFLNKSKSTLSSKLKKQNNTRSINMHIKR